MQNFSIKPSKGEAKR